METLDHLLGQILQRNGFISDEQLQAALDLQQGGEKRPIGAILALDLKACTEDQLLIAVMQQYALLNATEGEED